ncbi:hypothetical protein [Ferruginibacter sp.]|nr:hypothetical protein [Ferruginibacter sp.]
MPIDVIKVNQAGLPTAKMDFTSVLNMVAPSFNYNKQSGADHVDLGTLRGLGPDQTLVLINGKRRHSFAFVALFGTRGRGASGTDLNAFPYINGGRRAFGDGSISTYGGMYNMELPIRYTKTTFYSYGGVSQQAKGWAGDNESGGSWDSVQMSFNGRRIFTKLAFNF